MLPKLFFGFSRVTTERAIAWHTSINGSLLAIRHSPPTPDPSPPRASRAGGGALIGAGPTPIQERAHEGPSVVALPVSVCIQASPQAFASSRTRRM